MSLVQYCSVLQAEKALNLVGVVGQIGSPSSPLQIPYNFKSHSLLQSTSTRSSRRLICRQWSHAMRDTSLLAHELFRLRRKCFYQAQPSSSAPESPALRTLSKKAARNFHALVLRAFENFGQQR